jgi:hypothetical protein
MQVKEHDILVDGRLLKTVRLENEWYEDLTDPDAFLDALRTSGVKADLFSFWQRFPNTTRQFDHAVEWEDLAVLPVHSFEEWWDGRIKSRTRGLIRKSEKMGVMVRQTEFDDEFVRGMVDIFNETPVRQGRPFWHYGKDFETVKRQFSRFLFREDMIGAYFQDKLIGFVMLAKTGGSAVLGQILSKLEHRDKAPNNALIAKAVELTARKQIPYLIYNYWNETGLTEFKRRNGFEKQTVPRYYLALTPMGRLALRLGAHRPLIQMLPKTLVSQLRQLRSSFYAHRYGATQDHA